MREDVVVKLKQVSFRYPGATADSLSKIDLSVHVGECVVLTGGSGCGKTTLTRVINGLATQFYEGSLQGEVQLAGKSVATLPLYDIGRKVGSIFQDPKSQFFSSITEDEIAFGCEKYGLPRPAMNARVDRAIADIDGEKLRGQDIHPMSSGEKQKIAIASVHAVAPQIYVFDEPSANLDMAAVEALRAMMAELKREGHTLIIAEHRLYYLTDLADRVLLMQEGRIAVEWSPSTLLKLSEKERQAFGIRAPVLAHLQAEAPPVSIEKPDALVVENMHFSYRKRMIFDELNFRIRQGTIVAVVGHNGVGKTTLARLLCGLAKEQSGSVCIAGRVLSRRQRRRQTYFVMQNTDAQLFGDSVIEELRLNDRTLNDLQGDALLDLYGLLPWKTAHPATLSGGQKQRLTLAVSDLIEAPLLILDEPTSGLDLANMQRISRHLRALAARGRTLLVITHDLEFAAMTASEVLHLRDDGAEQFPMQNNLARLQACLLNQK